MGIFNVRDVINSGYEIVCTVTYKVIKCINNPILAGFTVTAIYFPATYTADSVIRMNYFNIRFLRGMGHLFALRVNIWFSLRLQRQRIDCFTININ